MSTPRLAIAIVHYHAEALLAECLRRLRRSTLQDFSVCIVDNGSEDGLDGLQPLDPRVAVVQPGRNLGFAAGINRALRHLPSSPYVLLLNPDVLLEERTLAAVHAALEADPRLGAATCRLRLPDGRTDPACRRADPTLASAFAKQSGLTALFPRSAWLGRYQLRGEDAERPHRVESASGAFLMVRRAALQAAGGLDERFFLYGEDLDFCRTLRAAGWEIDYRPEASAAHVKGSGRVRAARVTVHFYRAMWIYYRKWGRHRRHPLVLVPLALAIVVFGAGELLRNAWRRRRRGSQAKPGWPVSPALARRWS